MGYLYRQSGYERQESRTHNATLYALDVARNRHIVQNRRGSVVCSDDALAAVDWVSRRNWTRAICQELESHFGLDETRIYPSEPLFLFTLVDLSCVFRADAAEIPIHNIRRIYRAGLNGLNYLAFIEPAYYVSLCPESFWPNKRAMSWHVHGIAWGKTAKQIRARFDTLEADGKYRPIIQGLKGAHVKPIPRRQLPDKIRYVLKSPRKAYRLYKYDVVSTSGEKITGFKQRTSDPRPGEWVTLFFALRNLKLDDLTFAGGDGSLILQRVKRHIQNMRS